MSKRNEFRRDPETHQLVLTKDTQIALHHDGIDVDYIIELDPETKDGQIAVHYAFDPEKELTEEERNIVVEDTKKMLNDMFKEVL